MAAQPNQPHQISTGRRAVFQVLAGGSAGFVEVCIMQPLDVVKTRMQIQRIPGVGATAIEAHYNGVFDCFAKMYRQEGLASYWKGLIPPVLAETPKRAIKFLIFEQSKQYFLFGSPTPTPFTFSMAGLTAGLLEAIAVNPFEVVKVAQQANRQRQGAGVFEVARDIVKRDGIGLRGLNKGVTATMGRNGVFNMIYFGFFHSVKNAVPEPKDKVWEFLRKVAIGFTAGTLGCLVNIPFDVAKSRIQGPQPVPTVIKYRSTMRTIGIVYSEEGVRALYKGLVPKIMRLGPGGAIMLLAFDYVYEYLLKNHS
ncbi:mitochondrial 2-oxodicarboxylate carrier [Drosophila grimshawi]|uniref:Mitochondrial 2-oxodicarboxylate carrier n=1 Tax=Drosophila grimshawi TaxID=7222 RepID=B4JX03_DROGR|nr:mitochondrial 2-oxodicarboxylate carrier [Drosophila grimshawi]XP_032597182.1 mitochondrial 2-oxodicarboxylate carrier [Drosophila grimshawi]EDV95279.1 GH17661 [Drosophila grimshawi]